MVFVQLYTGVNALFALCGRRRSGFDQCVGHAAPSSALLFAACAYAVTGRSLQGGGGGAQRRYGVFGVENGLLLTAALAALLYSLQSEWPYAEHNSRHHLAAIVTLTATSSAALALVLSARRRDVPLSVVVVQRGAALAVAALTGAALLLMHEQVNAYGTLMHAAFAVALLCAGAARLARAYGALSCALTAASVTFMGSQRGFALLWAERSTVPLLNVTLLHAALIAVLCTYGHLWLEAFYHPPPPAEALLYSATSLNEVLLAESDAALLNQELDRVK